MNAAEGAICKLKKASARALLRTGAPLRLWDDCLELHALIRSHLPNNHFALHGQVSETFVRGHTADISKISEHPWYGWVWWLDSQAQFPEPKPQLGRYLGPAPDIGPAMCARILKGNGQYTYRSTYWAISDDKKANPAIQEKMSEFDKSIQTTLGLPCKNADFPEDWGITGVSIPYEDDHTPTFIPTPEADATTPDHEDQYIGAEVVLPRGERYLSGTVKRRRLDASGTAIGRHHTNPLLDTREYVVSFPDSVEQEYTANVIAESMYSQCDPDGNQVLMMESITDQRKTSKAVVHADAFITQNGRKYCRKTTQGWELCIVWQDGTTSWERLASVKESNPIKVAEYAVGAGIQDEPAFAWWVPYVLKKCERIISAVNSQYHKRTHKFGIRLPKTIKEALQLDQENSNTLWQDAIAKEMRNV